MTNENSEASVQTIDAKGNAPDRRIATPAAALSAYYQAREIERRRDARFGSIQGIYDGFPPIPGDVMERDGHGDMPNVNTKQFQAKVDAYADTWNALTAQGEWAEVEAEHEDPMEADRRSKYLTACFNAALKSWDQTGFANGTQYLFESGVRDKQMGLYGIGVAYFCDAIDFRWRAIPTRKVLVPDRTRLCLDNCQAAFIEDDISVSDLYQKRNKPGWNEDAILWCLFARLNQTAATGRRMTFSEWVNTIRNNDIYVYSDFSPVPFVHVYTREFDNSISHSIIIESMTANASKDRSKRGENARNAFLFDKKNVADHWHNVFIPFADNAGPEGYWHGVKGFGDLMFDGCHYNNLMFNRTSWSAIMNNTPVWTGNNESEVQKIKQLEITFCGIINPGLTLTPLEIRADVNSAMAMFELGTRIIDQNARIFPQNADNGGGEKPTATQVKFDRADQAQFTSLQVSNQRFGLDALLGEIYRRIAQPGSKYPESYDGGKVAKQFREKAAKEGIPEEDLLKVKLVRSNRNGGKGSMALDLEVGKELLAVATPGRGQLNARKQIVSALKGPENVRVYIEEEEPDPTFEDVIIDQENLAIQGGKTPKAFGFQPPELHLQSHFALMGDIAKVVEMLMEKEIPPNSIQDAAKLHTALDSGIDHIGQHVVLIESVPRTGKRPALYEGLMKEARKSLNDLVQLSQTFGQTIESTLKKSQAQKDPVGPEMLKAQAEVQALMLKTNAEIQVRKLETAAKIENLNAQHGVRTAAKTAEHELNLGLKAEQSVAEQQMQQTRAHGELVAIGARTAVELEADRMKREDEVNHQEELNRKKRENGSEGTSK